MTDYSTMHRVDLEQLAEKLGKLIKESLVFLKEDIDCGDYRSPALERLVDMIEPVIRETSSRNCPVHQAESLKAEEE